GERSSGSTYDLGNVSDSGSLSRYSKSTVRRHRRVSHFEVEFAVNYQNIPFLSYLAKLGFESADFGSEEKSDEMITLCRFIDKRRLLTTSHD
ncbi:hypothetical protein, partial [Aeromonas salmonicida]|uniref:hypothetical protein n=1 Tax=Aeromonas salmonicida TaxID=645 RepID=UPI001A8EA510